MFSLNSFYVSSALQIIDKDYVTSKNCRWVKVSNDELTPIDITLYKVLDSTASSSGHGITLISQNPDKFLNAGETAIISNGDVLCGYTGKIYHSAISTANATPYFIDMKAPSITNSTNSSSTTISTNNNVQYNNDFLRKTFTFGDLALLSPRTVNGVAGGETSFWVKSIDSKNNALISNVLWSFGDGVGGAGATTSHRYVYPGSYIVTIEAETNSVYGYERINVIINSPNLEISNVVNTDSSSSVTIRNNSDEEIDIGGFILSMNAGAFKLARHVIIMPHAEVKLAGESFGFKRADNVKLLFENNLEIVRYNSPKNLQIGTENKSTASTSSPILNKSKNINYGNISKNKIITPVKAEKVLIGPIKPVNIVEKGVDSTWHKWLYWIYD